MATIPLKDANNATVNVELPLTPGRTAAATSRPIAFSNEDLAIITAIQNRLPSTFGFGAASTALRAVLANDDRTGTRTYGTTTRIAISSTSVQSAAITGTEVMIHASSRCFVKAGANPTAVADGDSIPLEAGEKFHKRITTSDKIAVIRDTEDGFLHISPVT